MAKKDKVTRPKRRVRKPDKATPKFTRKAAAKAAPKKPLTLTDWLRTATTADVIRLARAMETGAIRVYRDLARSATNPVTKAKFRYLVEEERQHKRVLERIAKGLKGRALPVTNLSEVDEVPDPKDLTKAVEASVRNEQRAETFYTMAARRCKSPNARKMLRSIAAMEKRHAQLLKEELKSLTGDFGWSSMEGDVPDEGDFWSSP